MQLTQFTDYSLRLLLYLSAHPNRLVPVEEVSRAYGVSRHHLVKVVQQLVDQQLVASTRGRGGGLRLNRAPADINIGALVRQTEPHLDLVECFNSRTNTCPIDRACGLKHVLGDAQRAFLDVLDRSVLADFLPRAPELIKLWTRHQRRAVTP
jgi:Rrf2 family nitric oxide-sensitive transcriptional repressor